MTDQPQETCIADPDTTEEPSADFLGDVDPATDGNDQADDETADGSSGPEIDDTTRTRWKGIGYPPASETGQR